MSVIMINFVVFDFTKKLTKMQVNVFHWPSIELSKQTYNPVLHSADILWQMDVSAAKFANQLITSIGTIINCRISAVNSKGKCIYRHTV